MATRSVAGVELREPCELASVRACVVSYLFEVIMRRHELKSTMMTSNRRLEDWGGRLGTAGTELTHLRWDNL
jgi:hypothetical protein